jgi:hypothetical protein
MTKYTLILLALAGFGQAQQGSVAGPVAGFVFDGGSQSLRPLLGIAGAATIGDPIASGYQLTAAYVAPRQDSAFGIAAAGSANTSAHYFTLRSATLSEVTIEGLMAQPERITYSPSGTAAVLYSNGQAQIVTGLPGSPSLAGSLLLRQGAQSIHPTSFAVSDDGVYLLFAVGSSIQVASQSGGVRGVMAAGAGASVAFAPGGSYNAAVAARGTGVVLIQNVPGGASQQTLSADGASFKEVAGLSFSADGTHLFVASAAAQSVVTLDLSGNRIDIACNCTPSELAPMGNLFRLNELGSGPLWLADAGSAGPRVVFVPALTAAK